MYVLTLLSHVSMLPCQPLPRITHSDENTTLNLLQPISSESNSFLRSFKGSLRKKRHAGSF